jgi:hypothetical protein
MFTEIDPEFIKQTDDTLHKRWFRDASAECDLLIWEDVKGSLYRFQFWHQDALIEWDNDGGIRSGHVDQNSGAFQHYQSKLYRLHDNFDQDLFLYISDLLQQKSLSGLSAFEKVKQILYDIANRDYG